MPSNRSKFCEAWLEKKIGNEKIGEWCSSSKKSIYDAYCKICKNDFSVVNQGVNQLYQHSNVKKHQQKLKELKGLQRIETSNDKGQPKLSLNLFNRKDESTKAEILWALKTVAQDWSFASCDGVAPLFRAMFNDSVPEGFSLSSSKVSYLISDAIGPYFHKNLIADVNSSPNRLFTLHYDETTNSQNNKELMIDIRYWSTQENEVSLRHLQTFFMGHAKGVDLAEKILESVDSNGLHLKNLLSLGNDGPNVNKTVWRIVNDKVLESRSVKLGLLDIGSCSLHTLSNALNKGLDIHGRSVSDLAIAVFYWFSQSSAREEDFRICQETLSVPLHKFIRHVETRWLTLQPAAERLYEQFGALQEYFLKFLSKPELKLSQNKKYLSICSLLKKSTMKAEICLVISACQLFARPLLIFQKKEPVIHLLYEKLRDLIIVMLTRIVKTTVIEKNKSFLRKINLDDSTIFLPTPEIGPKATQYLEKVKDGERKLFLISAQKFFIKMADYLIKNSPISRSVLQNLQFLKPSEIKKPVSLERCQKVARCLPLESGQDVKFLTSLVDEWRMLQLEEIKIDENQRIDHFWREVGKMESSMGHKKYLNIMKVVQASLCVPHGNSDVERGFSESQRCLTSDRTNMSLETINACLTIKET